jgi:hypothetical protein
VTYASWAGDMFSVSVVVVRKGGAARTNPADKRVDVVAAGIVPSFGGGFFYSADAGDWEGDAAELADYFDGAHF